MNDWLGDNAKDRYFMKSSVVTLKSFGDFVIAMNRVRRVRSASNREVPQVIAGEHVRDLAAALGVESDILFIGDDSWLDVPAAFDVHKRGMFSAIRSALELRQRLKKLHPGMEFIFDRLEWRERFIARGRQLHALPKSSENIYSAYDCYFKSTGYEVPSSNKLERMSLRNAIVVPGARIAQKIMSSMAIAAFVSELETYGIPTKVILLEDEIFDLPKWIRVDIVPRRFNSLIDKIISSDLVVSADSLPAHLSEFLGVPVFVSSPSKNTYWLPESAYLTNGWSILNDTQPLRNWLEINKSLFMSYKGAI